MARETQCLRVPRQFRPWAPRNAAGLSHSRNAIFLTIRLLLISRRQGWECRCPDASHRTELRDGAPTTARSGWCVLGISFHTRPFDRRVQAAHDPRRACGQSVLCWQEDGPHKRTFRQPKARKRRKWFLSSYEQTNADAYSVMIARPSSVDKMPCQELKSKYRMATMLASCACV